MKKLIALALAVCILLGMASVHAEGTDKYNSLTVGTTTPFSGNFMSDALGTNISDQDIRSLIHGYSLVFWDSANGTYQLNEHLVTAGSVSADKLTYTFRLAEGLTYNDGTPITARDYAFSLLLSGSPALREATGGRGDISRIKGGKDYQDGVSNVLAGFRIRSDYQFTLTIDSAYSTYFYELKVMDISPLPISVIAPGCEVLDDGEGAYISGPFSADLLKQTLTDPDTGYISHPSVTCGAYTLTDYDGSSVTLDRNEQYIGDQYGNIPAIPQLIIRNVSADKLIDGLTTEELGLVVRCAREDQIRAGMQLMANGSCFMKAYSRAGLAHIVFHTKNSPTADENIRKAICMCIDKEELTTQYTGAYGTPVKADYGIGQWMFMVSIGSLKPDEITDEEQAELIEAMNNVPEYELNTEAASELLNETGWNLNELGGKYSVGEGSRCKLEGEELVPLTLKLIYPAENGLGRLLRTCFAPYLAKAGITLETEKVPMKDLLEIYYGRVENDCDMILLGTNFKDVYDPSGEYDETGMNRLNGITDPELAELSVRMRSTEPGKPIEYVRRWIAYQTRLMSTASVLPLYSDAYLDFHIPALQNYEPGTTGSWTIAIQQAILSDYIPEEETEEEEEFEGDDLGDDDFDDNWD